MTNRICGFCGVNPAVTLDLCLPCQAAFNDDLNSPCVDLAIDALQDAEDERAPALGSLPAEGEQT